MDCWFEVWALDIFVSFWPTGLLSESIKMRSRGYTSIYDGCYDVSADLTLKSLGSSVRHWLLILPPPLQSQPLSRHHQLYQIKKNFKQIPNDKYRNQLSWAIDYFNQALISSASHLFNHSFFSVIINPGLQCNDWNQCVRLVKGKPFKVIVINFSSWAIDYSRN